MKHELKCWPVFFQAAWAGVKTFEIRLNDRGFQVNDEVSIDEWDPDTKEYTGREIHGFIRYVSHAVGMLPGYVTFYYEETGRIEN